MKIIKILIFSSHLFFSLLYFFLIVSCSKDADINIDSNGLIEIEVKADILDLSEGDVISINSNKGNILSNNISVNNDYSLRAELIPDNDTSLIEGKGFIKKAVSNRANLPTSNLGENVWYRLVVFYKEDGKYVTERLYQRGKEDDETVTPKLLLDGGVEYTFVAYSVNSVISNDLPVLGGPASGKNISNCFVSINSSNKDLLYFKDDLTISDLKVDYLNVLFKHQFSMITVVINSSATGYGVISASASLLAKSPQVQLNFSDNGIVRSGINSNLPLNFSGYNTTEAISAPVVLNSANITGSDRLLSISSLRIGEITATAQTVFANVTLVPGVKYKAILTFVSNDKLMDNYGGFGINAVRINGQVWMRHNLRADGNYSANPDVAGANIFGDYYQWGRIQPVSTTTRVISTSSLLDNWTTLRNTYQASWNGNTNTNISTRESNPLKATPSSGTYGSTGDPCPNGYRVPSMKEINDLLNYTDMAFMATNASGTNNGIGVIVSKRNAKAKLTLPAQGAIFAVSGTNAYNGVNSKGRQVRVWSSYADFSTSEIRIAHSAADLQAVSPAMTIGISSHDVNNTLLGLPIRCIAINSTLQQ